MWYIYIILAICAIYVVFAAYVRISLKFWSLQPVFHVYNLLYWIRPPGLIHSELPEINKYVDLFNIKMLNASENTKEEEVLIGQICNFIKTHYLRTPDAEYIPSKKNIMEYMQSSHHNSFISIYSEPKLLFDKGDPVASISDILAVISARPLHVTLKGLKTFPVYYVDNLCVHSDHRRKGIAPKLIQTHYYNLRRKDSKIQTCLFKREGELTAIVPLTTFETYGYNISALKEEVLPHASMNVIEITGVQLRLFADFIYSRTKDFSCVILPELSNIANIIKEGNIFIYGIIEHDKLIALYIFRDPTLKYGTEKTIECFATLSNCHHKEIFTTGFNIALHMCNKKLNATKLLLENTSHSMDIIQELERKRIPQFMKSPTAFFLYNYACYSSPSSSTFLMY
jgi:GNAT superfamily N-acetyltransferase